MCEGIWFAWNILICSIASIKILCFLLSLLITLKVLQPPSPMVLWFRQKWPLWAPGEQAPDAGTSQAQNESFPTDQGQEVSSDGWTERDQADISLTSWSSSISHIKLLLKVLLVLEQRFYAASSFWLLCDILKRGTQTSDPFLRAKWCFSRKSCLLPVRSIHQPPGLDSAISSLKGLSSASNNIFRKWFFFLTKYLFGPRTQINTDLYQCCGMTVREVTNFTDLFHLYMENV